MRAYDLNPEQAKQASASARITETGKYIGRFTRAEEVKSKQGTEGIEFAFESNDGQSADFLSLWTVNRDGKEIYGMKMVNAIMACLRTRSIKPVDGSVEKFQNGAKTKVQATIYPDLMNKPIGVLLQRETYEKNDGSFASKFNIYACFDATSGMTAGEILDRATKAEQLDKIMKTFRDKPLQSARGTQKKDTQSAPADEEFNDDIPW